MISLSSKGAPPLKEIVVTYLSKNCVPKINSYFGDGLLFFRFHLNRGQTEILQKGGIQLGPLLFWRVIVNVGLGALWLHRQDWWRCLWDNPSEVPESWYDDLGADDPWADLGAPSAHAPVSSRFSPDAHGDAPHLRDSLEVPIHCGFPPADRGKEFPAVDGAAGHVDGEHHLGRRSSSKMMKLTDNVGNLINFA